ncbi:DUF177 domain-containing protein [Chloroflexota bacterium]
MQINVSQQLKASIGSVQDYEVSGIANISGGESVVHGEVRLMRINRGILVKGELQTEVAVTCSRCLSLFSYPLTLNIEEEYFPSTDVISGTSLSLPEEPGCFIIDEHHILDLTEAIRQYALLTISMKPLCREDCTGLCPKCGHNLNQGSCDCLPREVGSHWSELSKLTLASGGVINKQKGTE